MKLLYEWGIPSAGLLIWIVLSLVIVPTFMRSLKKNLIKPSGRLEKSFLPQYRLPLLLTSPIRAAMRSQNTLF